MRSQKVVIVKDNNTYELNKLLEDEYTIVQPPVMASTIKNTPKSDLAYPVEGTMYTTFVLEKRYG